jgi:hypothetical protein
MNRWLLSICALVLLLMPKFCTATESMTWKSLSLSGKGVYLVKVKEKDKSNYYLIKGSDRVISMEIVEKEGGKFISLESLLEFLTLKPEDVVLIEATSENVKDDQGKLEAFSKSERKQIWGKAPVRMVLKETASMTWKRLSLPGKGVYLVKVKEMDKSNYYLFRGMDRVIPMDNVEEWGEKFISLESLLEFLTLKPADELLVDAMFENVKDDQGKLEALSESERKQIWGKAPVPKGTRTR